MAAAACGARARATSALHHLNRTSRSNRRAKGGQGWGIDLPSFSFPSIFSLLLLGANGAGKFFLSSSFAKGRTMVCWFAAGDIVSIFDVGWVIKG